MFRYSAILIVITVFFSSCAKWALDFTVEAPEDNIAPAQYEFVLVESTGDSYSWDFGDGNISGDSIAYHTYFLSGNYEVVLTGTKGKKIKQITKEIQVKPPEKCLVKIETPYGDMIAELFDDTPKHRDNFLKLSEEKYYDDLLFHRVINGFMIQGGDPDSKNAPAGQRLGAGGPGYQVDAEFTENVAHTKGALAAARIGGAANPMKKSSGSQFYIVQGRQVSEDELQQYEARLGIKYPEAVVSRYLEDGGVPFLDQDYTVFGQVIEGMEVIDKIAQVATNSQDRPQEDVTMKIVVIK